MDDDLERRLDRIERRLDRIHVLCTVLVCALGLLMAAPILFVVFAVLDGGVPAVVAVALLGALVVLVVHGRRAARAADA